MSTEELTPLGQELVEFKAEIQSHYQDTNDLGADDVLGLSVQVMRMATLMETLVQKLIIQEIL